MERKTPLIVLLVAALVTSSLLPVVDARGKPVVHVILVIGHLPYHGGEQQDPFWGTTDCSERAMSTAVVVDAARRVGAVHFTSAEPTQTMDELLTQPGVVAGGCTLPAPVPLPWCWGEWTGWWWIKCRGGHYVVTLQREEGPNAHVTIERASPIAILGGTASGTISGSLPLTEFDLPVQGPQLGFGDESWVDCNQDGYEGFGPLQVSPYPTSLLPDDSVCPVGGAHNDGEWVDERGLPSYQLHAYSPPEEVAAAHNRVIRDCVAPLAPDPDDMETFVGTIAWCVAQDPWVRSIEADYGFSAPGLMYELEPAFIRSLDWTAAFMATEYGDVPGVRAAIEAGLEPSRPHLSAPFHRHLVEALTLAAHDTHPGVVEPAMEVMFSQHVHDGTLNPRDAWAAEMVREQWRASSELWGDCGLGIPGGWPPWQHVTRRPDSMKMAVADMLGAVDGALTAWWTGPGGAAAAALFFGVGASYLASSIAPPQGGVPSGTLGDLSDELVCEGPLS